MYTTSHATGRLFNQGLRRATGMPAVTNTSTSSVNSIIEKITGFLDNTIIPLAREVSKLFM